MTETIKKDIIRHTHNYTKTVSDLLAVEKRIVISVNSKEVMSLYCTPIMVRELVVGMFLTENLIKGGWCVDRMSIVYGDEVVVDISAEEDVNLSDGVITSGCIGGITFPKRLHLEYFEDDFKITADDLKTLFRRFQNASELYKNTGCVHSAGLSDGKDIYCIAEDIGRHNAVDKVIGYALLENIEFKDKIMLASGRLSSEIVSKCARWQIPVVASRTSPTSLAVQIAEKSGVTVIGFVRADRFNIYTHPYRIIFPE